jgi:hypothetical protein
MNHNGNKWVEHVTDVLQLSGLLAGDVKESQNE